MNPEAPFKATKLEKAAMARRIVRDLQYGRLVDPRFLCSAIKESPIPILRELGLEQVGSMAPQFVKYEMLVPALNAGRPVFAVEENEQ